MFQSRPAHAGLNRLAPRRRTTAFVMVLTLGATAGSALAQENEPLRPLLMHETGVVSGVVTEAGSGAPVYRAFAILSPGGYGGITDSDGRFLISRVPGGVHSLRLRHVAYETAVQEIMVTPGDTVFVPVTLVPYAHRVDEVRVETDRVLPLTSPLTTRYTLPREVFEEIPFDNFLEAIPLIPGVVVHGDRLFFRGVGFEHVLPLIDGMPARDPLKGEWIMPPPDALVSADYIAGAFTADYGQQLGGVVETQLMEGGEATHARVDYKTDRLRLRSEENFETDHLELGASGPLGRSECTYAASWTGRLTDTYLSYHAGRTRQDLLGAFTLGDRMQGEQTGSFKLSYKPRGRPWRASLAVVHFSDRRKEYLHHYDKSGWVDYEFPDRDRYYGGFIADTLFADNWELYEGPKHVPSKSRSATLLMSRYLHTLADRGVLEMQARYARHRYSTTVLDTPLEDLAPTRYGWQGEPYYATHGDYYDYEDGASQEGGLAGKVRYRPGGGHDLRAGAGATVGRHRYFMTTPMFFGSNVSWIRMGSTDEWMKTLDAYVYAEDHWKSDRFTTMFLSFRGDHQRISGFPLSPGSSASGTSSSIRLGFMHPMTDVDGLHVQAGLLYQFPTLQRYFFRFSGEEGITHTAQRTRAVEIGMQHHFSERVVAYMTTYLRQYSEVVFSRRELSEIDYLLGGARANTAPGLGEVDALGLEWTVDFRPYRWMVGQFSATTSRTEAGESVTPWDRNLVVHGWLRLNARRGSHATLTWQWFTGEPYLFCPNPKGCDESTLEERRLPNPLILNAGVYVSPTGRPSAFRLFADLRNLLNRRVPQFTFSTLPSTDVQPFHFLDYYLLYDETGGYVNGLEVRDVGNPRTRSAGRNIRLGVELRW